MDININTPLLLALIGVIGWLGKRLTTKMDEVERHLTRLNNRTQKLEDINTNEGR